MLWVFSYIFLYLFLYFEIHQVLKVLFQMLASEPVFHSFDDRQWSDLHSHLIMCNNNEK